MIGYDHYLNKKEGIHKMLSSSSNIILPLVIIFVLTGSNAFFASAEMAIVTADKGKMKQLSEQGNIKAKLLEKLIHEPSNFLSTIQVGVTLASFFSSASAATGIAGHLSKFLATYHIPYRQELSMIGITLILSYITLVFGELVPKRIALKKADDIALVSAVLLYIVSIIAKPFNKILSGSTHIILRILGMNPEDTVKKISQEEIRTLIYQSSQAGCIEDDAHQMINSIFEFNNKTAKELMTPIKETFMINSDEKIQVILEQVVQQNYSRVPVYKGSIDHIIGILNIKDIIAEAKTIGFDNLELTKLLHDAYCVPETKKANELFKSLNAKKKHMAILINEYGRISGIVTMEDLIEEIMGEIQDEYDIEEVKIQQIDEHLFKVKGSITIKQLNQILGLQLPIGAYDTLSGYLISQLGELPNETHQELKLNEISYQILQIKDNRINDVQIQINLPEQ
ncbi:hemolysin family protein [Niameybacter massiliensis]|uniref:hemolysin family protein n=1 Tax=Niameybacter massiliensis TaxID=1658108 RepID=UPI001FA6FC90|nr:hemolysin family protein [Niameybacter massiliensis]